MKERAKQDALELNEVELPPELQSLFDQQSEMVMSALRNFVKQSYSTSEALSEMKVKARMEEYNKSIDRFERVEDEALAEVDHCDEVTPDLENADNVVLRPEIQQIGASLELTHLNTTIPWVLSVSADVADADTQSNLLTDRFILGGSTRTGAEIRLLQPFGVDIDFAIRAGQKTYDELDSSFISAGLGFNYGNCFIDLSGNEDEFAGGELAYHLSLTWTF